MSKSCYMYMFLLHYLFYFYFYSTPVSYILERLGKANHEEKQKKL